MYRTQNSSLRRSTTLEHFLAYISAHELKNMFVEINTSAGMKVPKNCSFVIKMPHARSLHKDSKASSWLCLSWTDSIKHTHLCIVVSLEIFLISFFFTAFQDWVSPENFACRKAGPWA
jgi:hypothetical protein